jgi:hypothetical protein
VGAVLRGTMSAQATEVDDRAHTVLGQSSKELA